MGSFLVWLGLRACESFISQSSRLGCTDEMGCEWCSSSSEKGTLGESGRVGRGAGRDKRATLVGSFLRSVIHAPWEKQSHPAEPHTENEDEHGIRGRIEMIMEVLAGKRLWKRGTLLSGTQSAKLVNAHDRRPRHCPGHWRRLETAPSRIHPHQHAYT